MTLYSVLIVDDDLIARSHLKNLISWEELGFEVKGEAEHGKEAMDFIKNYEPDVVITDMNMPILDGVTLIRWIKSTYPEMAIIAVSGYDDFHYVKASLQGGAIDYVLKHQLDAAYLTKTLESARVQLEAKESKKKQREDQELLRKKLLFEEQQEYLRRIILEPMTDLQESQKVQNELSFENQLRNSILILIDLDGVIEEQGAKRKIGQLLQEMIKTVLQQEKGAYYFMESDKRGVILISYGNPYSLLKVYNDVYVLVQRIQSTLKRYLNRTASYSISNIIPKSPEFHENYLKLCGFYEHRFIRGKDQIFMANEVELPDQKIITLGYDEEKQILLLLRSKDYASVQAKIKSIYHRLREQRADRSSVMIITRDFVRILIGICKERKLGEQGIFLQGEGNPYHQMEQFDTFDELETWVLDSLLRLVDRLHQLEQRPGYSETVQKAIDYIHDHYKEDISLNEVAEALTVSSAHLSRLFKEECGTNYIKYLNECRVEKAKELMTLGIPLREVAQMAGFNHYNYFFKVFKDYTFVTPQEYMEGSKKLNG